jgi:acetyl-CoA acetyltransferase
MTPDLGLRGNLSQSSSRRSHCPSLGETMFPRDSLIAAYAETKIMDKSDKDVWVLSGEILESLLDKSGLEKADLDGFVISGSSPTGAGGMFWAQATADQLGLDVSFLDEVHTGGCSAVSSVARAAAAIEVGMCQTVLVLFADTQMRENNLTSDRSFRNEWISPYGEMGAPGAFALLTRRYEEQYGLDYTVLGKLAVTQRNHALLNENACEKLRVPITIDDYLNSRMISDPIRLLDCVMPADGAAGLVMTGRRHAREMGLGRCVVPLGYAERTNFKCAEAIVDITRSSHEIVGEKALAQAGIHIEDIASFHPYDDFLIAIILQFEALGFCGPGEGIAFARDTDLSYRGDLPMNTGGGQISAGQAACASQNLIEAVRQLMGEAGQRQVHNTSNALVTGIGGISYGRNWSTSAALVLAPDE